LNSDDFLANGALARIGQALAGAPSNVGAVVGIGHKLNSKREVFYSPLPKQVTHGTLFRWCQGENFMQPACFFRRAAWEYGGPLRLDLDYCMDLALWLRIACKYEFVILEETVAFIETHPNAKTIVARPKMFAETALLFASQPDGWQYGKDLLFQLIDSRSRYERSPILRALGTAKRVLRRSFA
jgi:hypothetical protein